MEKELPAVELSFLPHNLLIQDELCFALFVYKDTLHSQYFRVPNSLKANNKVSEKKQFRYWIRALSKENHNIKFDKIASLTYINVWSSQNFSKLIKDMLG